ncbi:hypothetical protein LCGC14_0187770 [marine sediment metagenome]|uniref:Uncharacterized protein n=1 Tax=marine sediment metagenome TaxID=412755 RepID=A0A0F9UMV7_9ZZZZ
MSAIMIEPEQRPGIDRRVFRRMECGSLEWAHYSDWQANGTRARFYGYASKELPPLVAVRES